MKKYLFAIDLTTYWYLGGLLNISFLFLFLTVRTVLRIIAVGDLMFLGMQDCDFAQIQSNFPKS